ncbi:MarR family winged helix-turn-helix transcriptional regulator [Candidatus Thalassolituus haligoni]|uniref:MarR family winged helix-turn-helix transcriptional regulator n=1 Tax=Candidatus Thalassolituus haligoni TaxID=3100113 RepID=UPI0035173685
MHTPPDQWASDAPIEEEQLDSSQRSVKFWDNISVSGEPPEIAAIYMAPAHLIRRSHQISVALFADELGKYGLTSVQYASLLAIRDHGGIDQRGLGNIVAIDRSTVATMLKGLENKGLVRRLTPPENLRVKQLYITDAGNKLLRKTVEQISRIQQRLLAPLSAEEQDVFMALLSKLVHVNNKFSRVPLKLKMSDSAE